MLSVSTDFVVIVGVVVDDKMTHALLSDNPRRNLLQTVILTSNNKHATDFVLVGSVKNVPCHDSMEAQASWVRACGHRRVPSAVEEVTDFVVVGGVAEPGSADLCHALLKPALNPRRALLQPVVLTSNNRRSTDFVLVGSVRDVTDRLGSSEIQAAWLRNHRRAQAKLAAELQGNNNEDVQSPRSICTFESWLPAEDSHMLMPKAWREERSSNNSVMSFL
jgi:hypothetical protein